MIISICNFIRKRTSPKTYKRIRGFYRRHLKGFGDAIQMELNIRKVKRSGDVFLVREYMKRGCTFPHFAGIVISKDSKIGSNCIFSHNVTIGQDVEGNAPIIKDNVQIFPCSVIFGKITIGRNVIIGAGSIVNKSIPDGETWAGNPAKKVISKKNKFCKSCDICIGNNTNCSKLKRLIGNLPKGI